ncbi:MAG: protein kinase [Acidobacteria bacterium]|nr:protein kinase [Acidobacteriota bacterium]
MTCTNCHSPNKDEARFCTSCGALLLPAQAVRDWYASTVLDEQKYPVSLIKKVVTSELVGQTIAGKYRIEVKLGAGGMGQVYRATRLNIGDRVAVKILQPEFADQPQLIKRFHLEAQAAARLKHPNVVAVYDFGTTASGLMYLVMEMVEGHSLREVMNRHGRFTPHEAYKVVAQICAALDEAHHHNIVHRDLKPDNILVASTTHGKLVKVVDFGIAKLLNAAEDSEKLTQTGAALGTPYYMPPEQCLGQAIDQRADLYSLGILLFEMLAGSVPFRAPTAGALMMQHVNDTPPPLTIFKVPIAVEAVVMRALAKAPRDRQQSAREFATQLKAAIKGAAANPTPPLVQPSFYPPTVRERTSDPARLPTREGYGKPAYQTAPDRPTPSGFRHRVVWLMGAALVCLVAAGLVWWRWKENAVLPAQTEISTGAATGKSPLTNFPTATQPTTEANSSGESNHESVETLLAQAENDFCNRRFRNAIATCTTILAANPQQATANRLLGQSYYNEGSDAGIGFLVKALEAGEKITLPIKHHHFEGMFHIDDGFCVGALVFQKGGLAFRSDEVSEHSFSVSGSAITDLRNEADKAGRIHIKAPFNKNGREVMENFNFHPPAAGLNSGKMRTTVFCNSPACLPQAETVYQLFLRLRPTR